MRHRALSLLLWVSLVAGLQAVPARGGELLVFAAASLTESLNEIGKQYHESTGSAVSFNFGASSALARQIEEGAPADLFFSADAEKVDTLVKRGNVVPETRRELLSNRLVIVVAAEAGAAVSSPADLASAKVRVLALAEPQSVPAGIYAREYLRKAGLWSKVIDKVVPTENVRAALAAVEAGNADAAIVYATDAMISKKVRVAVEIPESDTPKIVYVAAIPTTAHDVPAARRLLDYLGSESAGSVFRRFGFVVLPTPTP